MKLIEISNLPVWNPLQIDPSLLTFKEWLQIIDANEKTHPSTAYDVDLEQMNSYDKKENYPELLQRITRHGVAFEIRLQRRKLEYIKRLPDGTPERIDNELQYWSDEEVKNSGYPLEDYTISIWDKDKKVGSAQDEWGAVLVMVAREYRGFGLGLYLTKLIMSIFPGKSSGGFTPGGKKVIFNAYQEFVREAIRTGKYLKLAKQKSISIERVRQIVASAGLPVKSPIPKEPFDFKNNDPRDWLLFVGEYGDFILYDKKIKDLLQAEDKFGYFVERMILGAVNVREMSHRKPWALLTLFGGNTDKIRKFMIKLAASFCKQNGLELWIDQEDMHDVANIKFLGDVNVKTGRKRVQLDVEDLEPIPYVSLGHTEQQFRKSFDTYGEFKDRIQELAYSKFS